MITAKTSPDGKKLTIEVDLEHPEPSSSGKMFMVGGTGGWQRTDAKVDGHPLSINLNVGFKAPAAPAAVRA